MGELTIRRNGGIPTPRYQEVTKTEKTSGTVSSQKVEKKPGFTVSESLRQLMSRVSQAEAHTRESRRTLRAGEAVLAEVKDSLTRMAELADEAANGGEETRPGLQEKLEQLEGEIDRMLRSAVVDGVRLFLDEDGVEGGTEALLYAALNSGSANADGVEALPDWLMKGLSQGAFTPDQLLSALGLDKNASGADLIAALAGRSMEDPAAGYLAALYLGAAVANGAAAGAIDPEKALEGLQQFMEKVAQGMSPDEAINVLTNGEFTSLADFQAQFSSGAAPGLQAFLVDLLLSGGGTDLLSGVSLLDLLAGADGVNLDLMLGLLDALQSAGTSVGSAPEMQANAGGGAVEAAVMNAAKAPQASTIQFGNVQVTGQDLSGVSFNSATGELTIGGTADVTVQGTGEGEPAILLATSGTVTLQNINAPSLTVHSAEARIFSAGQNVLNEVFLQPETSLTFSGGGLVKTGAFHANAANLLRLTGGAAVAVEDGGKTPGTLTLPVVLDGPASLSAQAARVSSANGKALEPLDMIWKTLLPGWNSITAIEINNRQAKMALEFPDPARIWLAKGDPSHGSPIHTVIVHGKDESGRPRTRYAYLHWNQNTSAFEEISMFPNPFTVTGGESGKDWFYEEETHTLCILSNQVTAISGGSGTGANQEPFSGRIALANGIGGLELALGGVVCRVSSGRAFSLGCGNDVTLFLQSNTSNHFESGEGYAGISLGDGTSLRIDCPDSHGKSRSPAGMLTASGGSGGAGVGRDSGSGKDRTCQILIHGGVITAEGTGGGAGIGAGKHGFMGSITILGGTVHSTGGSGGGAGIGGALGAPVGDISIRGGKITAVAVEHAAAIGAGVQGACGDILITGTARVLKATGGNPGADIGACLFGNCGKVLISGAADIGRAKLRRQGGISLRMGEDSVTLPQFRLSSAALQLSKLRLTTRESAVVARSTLNADLRWVEQIQSSYHTMYGRLDQSFRSLHSAQEYIGGPVRDAGAAATVLEGMRQFFPRQAAQAMYTKTKQGAEDIQHLLLW